MAVRDDFAPGEVLAAADLNDTFASKLPYSFGTATPTTTDSGFLWYDSNSTPAAPKFWTGSAFQPFPNGLTHVQTESFTTSSAVSVNNVFTSAFANYRVVIAFDSSAASGVAFSMRMRASGSDNTTGNYYLGSKGLVSTGSDVNISQSTTTSFQLSWVAGAGYFVAMDVMRPADAVRTAIGGVALGLGGSGSTTFASGAFAGSQAQSVAFDGLSIFPASGTITGTMRIYGYNNG